MNYVPKLVKDIVPKIIPVTVVHRVLQRLLRERISIRDLQTSWKQSVNTQRLQKCGYPDRICAAAPCSFDNKAVSG